MQDLCNAAVQFARDTLKPGGHFVCKFYQGAEDKELEMQLKKLFRTVHREKPESSRSVRVYRSTLKGSISNTSQESKEAYFVAMKKKADTAERKVQELPVIEEPSQTRGYQEASLM